jgi:DNA-binding NarL/FixJ family response regulator
LEKRSNVIGVALLLDHAFGLLTNRLLTAVHVIYSASMTIGVLLADDSEIVRKAIMLLLKDDPEIRVLAEAESFSQTIQLSRHLHPHIVLLDLHMGDETGVTPSAIKSSFASSQLLAISLWNDDETKALADSYGAVALLDKTKLAVELIPAIKRYVKE